METIIILLKELYTAILALIIGLVLFKNLTRFYRILFLQVFIYVVADIIAVSVGENGLVFNVLMPFETALLLLAAQAYFNSSNSKLILSLLYLIFLASFFTDIYFRTGISVLATYASSVQGFLISGVYITILFFYFMKKKIKRFDISLSVSCIGLLIYFAPGAPYLSLIWYIQDFDPNLNEKLFIFIVVFLASIRYLCIAIAFYIAGTRKPSPSKL